MTPEFEQAIRETLEISRRRRVLMTTLLAAAEQGDLATVIRCGRQLRGQEHEPDASDSSRARLDGGAGGA